ncbi:cytochrome c oxidase assembly protein [Sporosarcina sp. Te-1]|uniref:cytochrome c oxidase assembly protein n=1 Tax=Sporosarcina sp. Te-1 TaxID=2818390 RepID=UPI001A9FF8A5|nr:cytochrome c oxidase assembly protein [Sporosarcina sp. Te-1]QTD41801.1 cytochrome c oxidase assembly protein [Sporosarcina sp. Te-1]
MVHHEAAWSLTDLLFGLPACAVLLLYSWAVVKSNRIRRLRKWPVYRTVLWFAGVLCASAALIGPLAALSHHSFTWHMVGHLLLGMLGPLLMVLAAPMTLVLRTLDVKTARRLSKLLSSPVMRFYTNPIVASLLNIGGLWILYTTGLFQAMHTNLLLHVLVHLHVFAAGYLFTISLIYIDPVSHRHSFRSRTVVFIAALAGHGILSKYLYAYPPNGVEIGDARLGAMLMYYGGDAVDLLLIIVLFHQWYRSARRKPVPAANLAES